MWVVIQHGLIAQNVRIDVSLLRHIELFLRIVEHQGRYLRNNRREEASRPTVYVATKAVGYTNQKALSDPSRPPQ